MYPLNQLKTLVSCGRDSARSLPFRRGFLLIPLMLVCFAFSPQTQAVPQPDSPDPGNPPISNTRDGINSLLSITSGIHNSAFGFDALLSNSDASFNTAVGTAALFGQDGQVSNSNNAVGAEALENILDGGFNNAMGVAAMGDNASGDGNVAIGDSAGAGIEGNFNIYIGFGVTGPANEDNTIRIGDTQDT